MDLPKKRSEKDLSAVDLIQHAQIFFIGNLVRVWLLFKCFHVIVKIKFSTFVNGKPNYLQQKRANKIID